MASWQLRIAVGLIATSSTFVAASCGGKVDFATSAGTGAGGSPLGTTSSSSNSTTGTGTSLCHSHADCPGGVCIFSIGVCAKACNAGDFCDGCDPGSECNGCATSSCEGCKDCMAACVPIQPNHCDSNDACTGGKLCEWPTHTCISPCTASGCSDPNLVCSMCAASSCCGCEDCQPACVPATN